MSFSAWFWKYGYILMVPVFLLFFWLNSSSDRDNQAHTNPEVFAAFEEIERKCNSEDFDNQSDACAQIFKHKSDCKQVTRKCNSLIYYDFLKSIGFALPPYYEDGYDPVSFRSTPLFSAFG